MRRNIQILLYARSRNCDADAIQERDDRQRDQHQQDLVALLHRVSNSRALRIASSGLERMGAPPLSCIWEATRAMDACANTTTSASFTRFESDAGRIRSSRL